MVGGKHSRQEKGSSSKSNPDPRFLNAEDQAAYTRYKSIGITDSKSINPQTLSYPVLNLCPHLPDFSPNSCMINSTYTSLQSYVDKRPVELTYHDFEEILHLSTTGDKLHNIKHCSHFSCWCHYFLPQQTPQTFLLPSSQTTLSTYFTVLVSIWIRGRQGKNRRKTYLSRSLMPFLHQFHSASIHRLNSWPSFCNDKRRSKSVSSSATSQGSLPASGGSKRSQGSLPASGGSKRSQGSLLASGGSKRSLGSLPYLDLDFNWDPVNKLLRETNAPYHDSTAIIPKAGDQIHITSILSLTTYYIIAHQDFTVVDLIIRYIEHLTSIRDSSHKRKPNLALRHIIAYVLKSKYNIKYPAPPEYLPTFCSNSSFHILHSSHQHPVNKEAMAKQEGPIFAPIPIH
ncbi:hypothetical protein M5K25_002513 [Dendrobium thyrsiflorum]|uniref:Uncharacterized protein n=1 Tax=Dendrobium thyrsiflorum TaxID=117978 RepID=A0ABD0VNG8_DENTH